MIRRANELRKKIMKWKNIVWDVSTDFKVSYKKKIEYAIKGFNVNEYIWYNLEKNDYKQYISEYNRMESRKINGDYKFILDDKIVFEEIFRNYTHVPINYAWISDGTIYGLHDYQVNNDNILEFLNDVGKSVFKYLGGGGGGGTYIFEVYDENIFINGKLSSKEDVIDIFNRKGQSILCEYISQSKFSAMLYPKTTNTIRIVCAKMKEQKEVEIIAAVQRIGCNASIPVDNFHSGGLASEINLDTGELNYAISCLGEMKNRLKYFECHPDTGAEIKGIIIPNWKSIKDEIRDLTNKIPYINFVAWDVLLTDEGYCIIEGNASSSCDLFQMNNGMKNSKLGDVYKSYGLI